MASFPTPGAEMMAQSHGRPTESAHWDHSGHMERPPDGSSAATSCRGTSEGVGSVPFLSRTPARETPAVFIGNGEPVEEACIGYRVPHLHPGFKEIGFRSP